MTETATTLEALETALGATFVAYGWIGPDGGNGIYFNRIDAEGGIASIKAGRQHRNETIRIQTICQAFADGVSSSRDAYLAVIDIFSELEEVCANNPQLAGVGQVLQIIEWDCVVQKFKTGWSARITATVSNTARLT